MAKNISVPRKVNYKGVPHQLAYVTKKEMSLMRKHGGSGEPGVAGIPTFIPDDGNRGGGDFSSAPSGPSGGEFGGGDPSDKDNYSLSNYVDNQKNQSVNTAERLAEAEKNKALAYFDEQTKKFKARSKEQPLGLMDFLKPGGAALKGLDFASQKFRENIRDKIKEGGKAIFDGDKVVGVVHDGMFGKVYTGTQVKGYTGAFANLVEDKTQQDESDKAAQIYVQGYTGGRLGANPGGDGINQELPDAPEGGELGDADLDNQAKKKYGQQEQVGTTPQGLLTKARTRRRSLLATGLLT